MKIFDKIVNRSFSENRQMNDLRKFLLVFSLSTEFFFKYSAQKTFITSQKASIFNATPSSFLVQYRSYSLFMTLFNISRRSGRYAERPSLCSNGCWYYYIYIDISTTDTACFVLGQEEED